MKYKMNLGNVSEIANEILKKVRDNKIHNKATILTLQGDLGSGKTHITKEIGKLLGVVEEINSPTFVVMKMYETKDKDFRHLIHIDAYRLEEQKDKDNLKLEEVFSKENTLIVLEWPEIIQNILPKNSINVQINHLEDEERIVNIE